MNRAILKTCCVALSAILVVIPLGACAVSNAQRASHALKRMKAEQYFADRIQAELATAVGRGEIERARQLVERAVRLS